MYGVFCTVYSIQYSVTVQCPVFQVDSIGRIEI